MPISTTAKQRKVINKHFTALEKLEGKIQDVLGDIGEHLDALEAELQEEEGYAEED